MHPGRPNVPLLVNHTNAFRQKFTEAKARKLLYKISISISHLLELLSSLLLAHAVLIYSVYRLQSFSCCLGVDANNATVPPNLPLLMLNICQRSLVGGGILISEDEDLRSVSTPQALLIMSGSTHILIFSEKTVNVFKRAICSFRIEEVDDRYESSIENSPYDVEAPVEGLDACQEIEND